LNKLAFSGLLSKSSGYSLIELLVAVTILGLVVAPFLGLFGGSYQAIAASNRQTKAVYLAQQKIETLKSKGYEQAYEQYIVTGDSPQVEEKLPGEKGFVRTTSVSARGTPENGVSTYPCKLLKIEVNVSFAIRSKEEKVSLSTYLSER